MSAPAAVAPTVMGPTVGGPIAEVDALVRVAAPGLPAPPEPGVGRVLVVGPARAGVTAVRDALARRLPALEFVEGGTENAPERRDSSHGEVTARSGAESVRLPPRVLAGPGQAPELVVFVASAAASLTPSDCAVLDTAARHTDAVIGVVTKIDLHRCWRDIRVRDAEILADHDDRYRGLRWVGAAAVPDLGPSRIDDLVAAVTGVLADPARARRNRLRSWSALLTDQDRDLWERAEVGRAGQRDLAIRRRQLLARTGRERAEAAISLRTAVQRTRIRLGARTAGRCTAWRAALTVEAALTPRRALPGFTAAVTARAAEEFGELDRELSADLRRLAGELGLPTPGPADTPEPPVFSGPPDHPRRLEARLILALGGGFGLGLAWTSSRALAGLLPAAAGLGTLLGLLAGLAAGCWLVGTRRQLARRATLEGWLGSVTVELRAGMDRHVAARLLAAEAELTSAAADARGHESAVLAAELRDLDLRGRDYAREAAAAEDRYRRARIGIESALAVVCAESGRPPTAEILPDRRLNRSESFL